MGTENVQTPVQGRRLLVLQVGCYSGAMRMRKAGLPTTAVLLLVMGVVALAGVSCGDGDTAKPVTPATPARTYDDARLQGAWMLVETIDYGDRMPPEAGGVTFLFEGDKCYTIRGDKRSELGTFTLDPAKQPRAIDLRADAAHHSKLAQGVYDLTDENLTMYFNNEGRRPTVLEPTTDNVVFVLKRQKDQ